VVVLMLCFYVYSNISDNSKFLPLRIGMIFLIAGAIGNMIDRIKLGYVVDFFYFELIDFPIFNVADIYVTCSMIFIFLLMIFKYDNDDFDIMLGSKHKKEAND
jgi:signal peptidase II